MVPEFSRPVPVGNLSRVWREKEVCATETECRALAERLDLITMENISGKVSFRVSSTYQITGCEVLDVEASLSASITQACVLTMEPVASTIDTVFTGLAVTPGNPLPGTTDEGDFDDMEAPEILAKIDGGQIDIGELLVEQLCLEMDPFPKKPGARLDGAGLDAYSDDDPSKTGPFAALAKLRNNRD